MGRNKIEARFLYITIFLVFIILMSNSFAYSPPNKGCECNGTVVKFNWENDKFVLEEGHIAHGIEISKIQFDDDGDPFCFDWTSTHKWVISICLKLGQRYDTFDLIGGSEGGNICADIQPGEDGYRAISHIEFCVDESLPVELSLFNASISNNSVALIWETTTEINNYGFEIQRSYDADDEWQSIGFVEGYGNSNSPKYYSYTDQSVSESGEYFYRLKQIDIDGQYEYTKVLSVELTAPDGFKLNQNYPNPFNPSTTISYSLPIKSDVKLIIYDLFGQEVKRLVDESQESGNYAINFDGSSLASGVYIYTIKTNEFSATKRLILLK